MTAWGMPGIGGSLGCCAICGESFVAGVLKDLCGMDSGIRQFGIGDYDFCAHDPKCFDILKSATDSEGRVDPQKLPYGPLRAYGTGEPWPKPEPAKEVE